MAIEELEGIGNLYSVMQNADSRSKKSTYMATMLAKDGTPFIIEGPTLAPVRELM